MNNISSTDDSYWNTKPSKTTAGQPCIQTATYYTIKQLTDYSDAELITEIENRLKEKESRLKNIRVIMKMYKRTTDLLAQ